MRCAYLLAISIAACHARSADPAPAPTHRDAAAAQIDAMQAAPCDGKPIALGKGVTAERWTVARADACMDLVRIDLADYQLEILAAAREGAARPAPRWADDFGLVAVINLAMFKDDGAPVALAIDSRGALNARDNPPFGGFLAFDPVDPRDPPVTVAGRSCAGFELDALKRRYRGVVQSYRMLDCDGGAIAWKDAKRYSAAAVGVDRDGRLVLVHVRAPFTMKALSAALAKPELRLQGAIFVEGGPEASLVVRADRTLERVGSFETSFLESDENQRFWDLPNVLGVARAR
ncbi:MAG TPA: phosphodiester glycosidase family protein [Kofleriaceae bacterium]|nr:phosphodiester glycosidase family protein [Kofleriaceae bacterium]